MLIYFFVAFEYPADLISNIQNWYLLGLYQIPIYQVLSSIPRVCNQIYNPHQTPAKDRYLLIPGRIDVRLPVQYLDQRVDADIETCIRNSRHKGKPSSMLL